MKIVSRNTLLQNDKFILESIHNLIRSSRLNEVSLEGTSTPDFKDSQIVKRYEVNIGFQSGGDSVTVSVSQLKEK